MINIKSWSSSFCRHCTGHQSNLSPQFSHRSTWQTQRNHLVLTRQTRLHSEHPSLFCMLLYMTVSLQMTEAYQSKSERITVNHQMASSQVKVFFICSALLCNWTRSETLDLERYQFFNNLWKLYINNPFEKYIQSFRLTLFLYFIFQTLDFNWEICNALLLAKMCKLHYLAARHVPVYQCRLDDIFKIKIWWSGVQS